MASQNYYNVTEWNTGDPYEDIGVVINSIIADIKARQTERDVLSGGKPGAVIYIPPGDYHLKTQVVIDLSYLKIQGSGHGFTSSSIRFNTPADQLARWHEIWPGGSRILVDLEPGIDEASGAAFYVRREGEPRISSVEFSSFCIDGLHFVDGGFSVNDPENTYRNGKTGIYIASAHDSFKITGMGMIQGMTGAPINIVSYMLVGVPVGVVCFAGMYLVLRYGYKADMSQFQNVDILALVGEKAEPMSKREKATTAIFAAVVICWLAAGFLNIFAPESGAAGFFNQISLIMPALAGVAAMLVLRVDGRPLLDFEKACRGGVTWSIILLIATVMMLGTVLSESTTGFTATVGEILQVLLSGGLSAFLVLFLIAAVIIVLTNFFNNVPVMILFLTVCVPLADSIGTTGLAVGTIILIAAEMAFATPAAFATIAMIYADDYVQPKRVLKYGMIVMVWTVLAVGLLAYPLASIVF